MKKSFITSDAALIIVKVLIRIIIGVYFLYAGWGKIVDPWQFYLDIKNYQILSPTLAMMSALSLPWIEVIVGLFFIVGFNLRGSALILTGLMGLFILAILSAVWRGLDISCGCISGTAQPVGFLKIIEDVFLFFILIIFYFKEKPAKKWVTFKLI